MKSRRNRKTKNKGKSLFKTMTLFCIIVAVVALIGAGAWLTYRELTRTPEKFNVAGQISNDIQDWPKKDKLKGSPVSTKFNGIDISRCQGRIIWDTLLEKNPSLQFIFIRAIGYGGRFDRVYRSQVDEARKRGIPVGSYIFFTHKISAKKQFELFKEIVEKEKQDLRPVIDVEDISLFRGNKEHLVDSVMVLARLMEEEYGAKPIIYSNESHYKHYLSPEFDEYPLWIANYSQEPKISGTKPIIWQYSEKGHLHGIWTYVDLDRFVNGATIEDIRR